MKKFYLFFIFCFAFSIMSFSQEYFSAIDGSYYESDKNTVTLKEATLTASDTVYAGVHISSYTSTNTRGYFFQAQSSFTIKKVMCAEENNPGALRQSVEIVSFDSVYPASTTEPRTPHTTLFSAIGVQSGWIDCDVDIIEGNYYALLGAKHDEGGSTMYTSYGDPQYLMIDGILTWVDRLTYPASLALGSPVSGSSPGSGTYYSDPGSPIGRVHFIVESEESTADDILVVNDEGLCSALVNYTVPLPNDTASVVMQIDTSGLTNGSIFPVGSTLQQYQINLGDGTLDTVLFLVIVKDTELPVLTCQNFTIELNENDSAIVTLNDVLLSYSDNCGIDTIYMDIDTVTFAHTGENIVTITVVDIHGNIATCQSTVIVESEELTADNILVENDEGLCSALVNYTVPLPNIDAFVIEQIDASGLSSDNVFPVGSTLQQYKIDLGDGTLDTVSFLVIVEDTELPELTCQNFTIELNENDSAIVTLSNVLLSYSDNCGIDTIYMDIDTVTFAHTGENTVTITVIDIHGNIATCQTTVTVNDNIPPTLICPEDIVVTNDPEECGAIVVYPGVVVGASIPSGSFFPIGTTPVTFTATDATTCTFNVTVVITTNALPEIDEIANVVVDEDTPSVLVDLTGISHGIDCEDQELTISAETDNEALATMLTVDYTSGSPTGTLAIAIAPDMSGTAGITVTVRDWEGGIVTETFTLTVNPVNEPPFLVNPVADQTVHASYVLKIPLSSVLGVMFDDIDDDELTISVVAEGTNSLPAWATYANDTLLFQPTIADTSCVNIVVTATDSSGATASDTFEICVDGYPVSINDLEANRFGVRLYPNPTNGLVNLELSSGTYNMELSVMDIAGRTVLRRSYTASERIIFDMSGKSAGMYFVKMDIEGKQFVEKLIVKD